MTIVKISSTRNARSAINYLGGKAHNGSKKRELLATGLLTSYENAKTNFTDHLQKVKKKSTQVEAYRVVQSFSATEIDVNNLEDVAKAHAIGCETAKLLFPNRQVVIVTQADGKNGIVHNHMVGESPDLVDGKALRGNSMSWKHVAEVSDKVSEDWGLSPVVPTKTVKQTTPEVKLREQGVYVWKDDLRQRIDTAKTDSSVVDFKSYRAALAKAGVEVSQRGKKTKMYSYQFEGENGKMYKSRANKLGSEYGHDTFEPIYKSHSKAAKRRADELLGQKQQQARLEAEEAQKARQEQQQRARVEAQQQMQQQAQVKPKAKRKITPYYVAKVFYSDPVKFKNEHYKAIHNFMRTGDQVRLDFWTDEELANAKDKGILKDMIAVHSDKDKPAFMQEAEDGFKKEASRRSAEKQVQKHEQKDVDLEL